MERNEISRKMGRIRANWKGMNAGLCPSQNNLHLRPALQWDGIRGFGVVR